MTWAAIAVGVALLLSLLTERAIQQTLFIWFFPAVTYAAWRGGLGSALFATFLSILAVEYFLLQPRFTFRQPGVEMLFTFGVFASVAVAIATLSTRVLRREREVEAVNSELRKNREFLEQAQRSAQLGSWEWDVPVNRISWSREMFTLYGVEPGSIDLSFDTFLSFVHPDDRAMVQTSVQRSFESHAPFAFDHRIIRADGAMRWLHGRGEVQLDERGSVVRMAGSGQDITDRRRHAETQRLLAAASETLASSLDYHTTLKTVASLAVESLADWCAVAIGDSSGRYENVAVVHRDPERTRWAVEYNTLHPPRFDAPTGVPNVLRTGKSEFMPEIPEALLEASAESPEQLRVIRELGLHSYMVVPMIARGRTLGAITFISAESKRRFTGDDLWLAERLAGRAAIAVDNARLFEEATAARKEAETANRAKMDFLASMSHELRTPLNAIAGYTDLIEMEIHGPITDAQRDTLARMKRSQHSLTRLIEQVLSFAKIEAGKLEYSFDSVNVHQSASRMGELIEPQARSAGVRYTYEPGDREAVVRADRERLEQIVLNLLSNAIKFTDEGGRVTLRVSTEGDQVMVSVTDTGIGIPPEKQRMLFHPFVQLSEHADRRRKGVGLGLAISRDMARAMGGDIRVVSTPGQGSTFTLALPLAPVAIAAGQGSQWQR
jgi:PAS domain S-box-containing protein